MIGRRRTNRRSEGLYYSLRLGNAPITKQTRLLMRPASVAGMSPGTLDLCAPTRDASPEDATPLDPGLRQVLTSAVTKRLGRIAW